MLSRLPPRRVGRPRCCKAGGHARSRAGGGASWHGVAWPSATKPGQIPPFLAGRTCGSGPLALALLRAASRSPSPHPRVGAASAALAKSSRMGPQVDKWVDIPREMGGLGSLRGDLLVFQPSSTIPSATLPLQPPFGPSTATSRMVGDLFVPCPRAMGHP